MTAQEACLSLGKKKRPLPTVPQQCLLETSLSQSKAELVRSQDERFREGSRKRVDLLVSLPFRLESVSYQDTIAWLQWVSASPGSLQDLIDRIEAGDPYLEAEVLEVRTEVGL